MTDSDDAPSAPVAPPPPDTLGQMLRSARLTQDLTLEQVATELRIEAKQLNALEQNRFEQIGVPVFIKGYLKQYGQRLGLNVSDLLALYYKQTTVGNVEIQPNRTIKLRDERQITSWILAAIVLLTVAVGLAAWWWSGFGAATVTQRPSAPAEAEPATEPPLAPPARTEPIPLEDAQPPVDRPLPGAVPTEAPAVAAVAAVAAVDGVDDDDDTRAVPIVPIPLEFSFEGESWAEVTDSRGQRLLFGLSAAGRRVTVRGEPPFAVVLGDANAVRLNVDGEPFAIPTTGRQGDLVRFSVDIAEE